MRVRVAGFGPAVALLLASAPAGCAGEKEAEAALKKLGGEAIHVGLDASKPVFKVEFNNPKLADDDLKEAVGHLKELPDLKVLHVGFNRVTDHGLAHLKDLTTLEELSLAGASTVTDKGLAHVMRLKNLKVLNVVLTKVTAAGVADLKKARPDIRISLRVGEEAK